MSGKSLGLVHIVEDDPLSAEILKVYLERCGLKTRLFLTGTNFLQQVKVEEPDLVILDVRLPDTTGFDICRHLKDDRSTRLIPVIFLTSLNSTEDRVNAIKSGGDDFVTKPFNSLELTARVSSLIKVREYHRQMESMENVMCALVKVIEARDPYTRGHSERVSIYARTIAQDMGLGQEVVEQLGKGALVHDVGKIGISIAVLQKTGPLSDREYREIKSHPVVGRDICGELKSFRGMLGLIHSHHEKLDGSGYPDGLKAKDIALPVRVLSVADVFDAVTSDRCYRKAVNWKEGLRILEEEARRGWWDPEVVTSLKRVCNRGFDEWEFLKSC